MYEGGARGVGLGEARICPVGTGAWGDGGLVAERVVGIGKNALHAETGDPANQRAARAPSSLDNENYRRVTISFNRREDLMTQTRWNADPTANKAPNRGSLVRASWPAPFLF